MNPDHAVDAASLMQALHEKNPYEGFEGHGLHYDPQGWNSERAIFHELLHRVQPRLVIEVGTWKGASAIHMGKYLQKQCPGHAKILAVDSWLGSLEFWEREKNPGLYQALRHRQGFPRVYEQFLFNVIHAGMQEVIIPFPQTSLIAARWLLNRGVRAELIYIDGSHDAEDVALDLKNYYAILANGGMIFGDDYHSEDGGVRQAVGRFAEEHSVAVDLRENGQFWALEKPSKLI